MNLTRRHFIQVSVIPSVVGLTGCTILDRDINHNLRVRNLTEEDQPVTIKITVDDEQVFNEQLTVEAGSSSEIISLNQPGDCEIVVDAPIGRYSENLTVPLQDPDQTSKTDIDIHEDKIEFISYALD